jgi:hypothetical protein
MNISWQQYFLFIGSICLLYYLAIAVIYYQAKLKRIVTFKKVPQRFAPGLNPKAHITSIESNGTEDLMSYVDELVNDVKQLTKQSSKDGIVKEELTLALQVLLKRYSILKNTLFVSSINQFLETEAATNCSIYFDEYELKNLWSLAE